MSGAVIGSLLAGAFAAVWLVLLLLARRVAERMSGMAADYWWWREMTPENTLLLIRVVALGGLAIGLALVALLLGVLATGPR